MRRLLVILLLALGCISARAIPVFNRRVTLTQPDGRKIEAFINGDERSHAVTDFVGHVLVQGQDKYWRYAAFSSDGSRRPSAYIVGEEVPQKILSGSLPPSARVRRAPFRAPDESEDPSEDLPGDPSEDMSEEPSVEPLDPTPVHRCLFLLVQFPGLEFRYSREEFVDLICTRGYYADGILGSMADYFEEQFRGDALFDFEVSGIITLDKPSAEYFANNEDGDDVDARGVVVEACRKAYEEQGLDFSRFDANADGKIDNIFVIVAGFSEAETGEEDQVWPHMAYVQGTKEYNGAEVGGLLINAYNISTELHKDGSGRTVMTGIGTLCHEYSHTLGLQDMYDVDYAGSGGMGNGLWRSTALMDGGTYNDGGRTPPHYNAIDYHILGLGTVDTLKVGTYVLEPVSTDRRFFIYQTPVEGEYFLLECRAEQDWDAYIGGSGLLIYHIDRSKRPAGYSDSEDKVLSALTRWKINEVNCRPDHQCARLVSATPLIRAYNQSREFQFNQGQIFYPCKEYDAFTALTSPAFVFWDGTESPLAITDIAREGASVRFTVSRMSDVILPEVAGVESYIFQDAAIISWEADSPEFEGNAFVTWGLASKEGTEVEVEPYAKGKYAITLDGLQSGKAYRAAISFKVNGITSKVVPVNFTTKYLYDNSLPFIYVSNVTRGEDGSFPHGSRLPLRIYNPHKVESVSWEYDGWPVQTSPDGFFYLYNSGVLTATIVYKDGSTEIIKKEISVR